jgi:hypothetical protein
MSEEESVQTEESVEVEAEEVEEIEESLETDEVETEDQVPAWMSEDSDEEESESSENVPVGALLRQKSKVKALRGEMTEKDDELERLRRENEELKASKAVPVATERPKRPRQLDFETDEDYEAALDKYEDDREQWRESKTQTTSQVKQQREQFEKRVSEDVDSHYERAEKLVKENSIKPEVYKKADTVVRQTVDSVMPQMGSVIVDNLISILGEGSEKVMFYLGRNKSALSQFTMLLNEDKSGLRATAYLGRISSQIEGNVKKTSRAPAPAVNPKGDAVSGVKVGTLKKKYDAAHKKGDTSTAFKFKREAKKAGHDTSGW